MREELPALRSQRGEPPAAAEEREAKPVGRQALGHVAAIDETQLEQAFFQGNKGACGAVDKGVQSKTAPEALVSCSKNFDKAKNAVEEKLKELDDLAGGGSGEAAPE